VLGKGVVAVVGGLLVAGCWIDRDYFGFMDEVRFMAHGGWEGQAWHCLRLLLSFLLLKALLNLSVYLSCSTLATHSCSHLVRTLTTHHTRPLPKG
jgi:hypothetical protein